MKRPLVTGTEYNRNLGNQQTSNGTNHYIESDTTTSAGIPIYETVQVWYIDIGDRNATIEENQRAEKLYQIQMWIVAVPCKILPCLLLVIMSGLLIHKLHQVCVHYAVYKYSLYTDIYTLFLHCV